MNKKKENLGITAGKYIGMAFLLLVIGSLNLILLLGAGFVAETFFLKVIFIVILTIIGVVGYFLCAWISKRLKLFWLWGIFYVLPILWLYIVEFQYNSFSNAFLTGMGIAIVIYIPCLIGGLIAHKRNKK